MSNIEAALRIARSRRSSGGEVTHLPASNSINLPEAPNKSQMDRYSYHHEVPLSMARSTQTTMDWRPQGERKSPGPLIRGYGDKPVAVKRENGEFLVYDGHHRSVKAMNEGRKHLGMHVINAKDYDPANAGRAPARQGVSDDDLMKELGLKTGGRVARASGGEVTMTHEGPINSAVAGRTDHLPLHVKSGSYILPADIVSAYGEGNTSAGFKVMNRLFGGAPYNSSGGPYNSGKRPYGSESDEPYSQSDSPYNVELQNRAKGGKTSTVPVVVAGGEYSIPPEKVAEIGEGDMQRGHRILDEFILRSRKDLVKTLSKLPGPARD